MVAVSWLGQSQSLHSSKSMMNNKFLVLMNNKIKPAYIVHPLKCIILHPIINKTDKKKKMQTESTVLVLQKQAIQEQLIKHD